MRKFTITLYIVIALAIGAVIGIAFNLVVKRADHRGRVSEGLGVLRTYNNIWMMATYMDGIHIKDGSYPVTEDGWKDTGAIPQLPARYHIEPGLPVPYAGYHITTSESEMMDPYGQGEMFAYLGTEGSYVIVGRGPDKVFQKDVFSSIYDSICRGEEGRLAYEIRDSIYDPTNGTESSGDIFMLSSNLSGYTPEEYREAGLSGNTWPFVSSDSQPGAGHQPGKPADTQ